MWFNQILSWLLGVLVCLFPCIPIIPDSPPCTYDLYKLPAEALEGSNSFDYWLEGADAYFEAVMGNPIEVFGSADSGSYAWNTSYAITALVKLFSFTGDSKYLDGLSSGLAMMFATLADEDGDGYLNWGCTAFSPIGSYEEYCVHAGVVLTSVAEYLNLVKGDPVLAAAPSAIPGKTLGEQADDLIALCCDEIIASFDKDWSECYGVYMSRPGSGNFEGRTKEATLPNNQYLAMAAALYGFAKLNPGKQDVYLSRADRMIANFKSTITFYKNGTAKWNYNDKFFLFDAPKSQEDYSHAMIDFQAMAAAYSRGYAVNLGNMRSIANTYETTMARGNRLSYFVDGSGDDSGRYVYHLFDLQSFGHLAWQRGEQFLNQVGEKNGCNAAYVLKYHPKAPTPTKPVVFLTDGASIAPDFSVLRWSVGQYASDYCLQIAGDSSFENLLVDRPYIPHNNAIVTGLPSGQTLYVRVLARNESGSVTVSDTVMIQTEGL